MNIDTLIKEEMNENEDKQELELIHKKSLLDNYALIKINGKLLKDIRVSDMGFFRDFSANRDMILRIKIPLDKYKIIINPDGEEMSINGERLKDITINNVSYNVSRDTNYAIFNIVVPLDKYKLVIDQRNKITPQF